MGGNGMRAWTILGGAFVASWLVLIHTDAARHVALTHNLSLFVIGLAIALGTVMPRGR